jgi:hypothetical protein
MMPGRDPTHWLYRFAPREWIQAGLGELNRADQAFKAGDRKGALACCRRAAGMGINGALALAESPDARYGRSYMDHLVALSSDETVTAEVRDAAKLLVQTPLPGAEVVAIRVPGVPERLLDATRTVMADAYARVLKSEPDPVA